MEQDAEGDCQRGAMTDHEDAVSLVVFRRDGTDRGLQALGNGRQRFPTRRFEGGIAAGAGNKVVGFRKISEPHVFPIADGVLPETIEHDGFMAGELSHGFGRSPTPIQGAGIDGRQRLMVRSNVAGRSPGLAPTPPGERAVGRAVPAALAIGSDLTVSEQEK